MTLTFNDVGAGFEVNPSEDGTGHTLTINDNSDDEDGKIIVNGNGERGNRAIIINNKCKFILFAGEISIVGNSTNSSYYSYAIDAAYGSEIGIYGGKVISDNANGHTNTINLSTDNDISIDGNVILENKKSNTDNSSYVINSTNCKGTKTIKGVTFESKANLIGSYNMSTNNQTVNFENCTFKKETSFEYTGSYINLKIENCTFDEKITKCNNKAILGTSSKFKDITGFENNWLAGGYSLSTTPDDDGYYHLTFSDTTGD